MSQPRRPVRTVLLDLDGTLVDSAALITEHLAAAIVEAGAPARPPAALRPLVGPPFEEALPELGLTDEQVATAITAYRASYDRVAATHTPLFPGVADFLRRLDGFRLAVATSKPEHLAVRIVDALGIGGHFELVGGADHVLGRVGKAAVVGSVLDRLALDPASDPVVMVGDRHHDVDGAGAYGVPTIGVAWGYAADGELAGAALVVAGVTELEAALRDGPTSTDRG
ncbi:MAG TPA: HAD-IA family hydrolase [Pseudonocardia sp.]|nr:HAD-IA family hydrolase [Pseudonocardia sp.]